ncbi:30S ribosomal protein S8 [Candidatus Roizmanbacteria bacterium RIFCSPLOWO2_01_FULL_37_13]|uniref:Small ribosomal subunit protein uS8 n=1 Tax=Candidatus Roizmanbacteria bacterium RIFCSPHIGHO2_02_FULL_38_11 TaxID=1802039 RepID=A0A1F7H1Y3_9BACT|nr:MAG: 30S ribosomal protein S8 [Candidatus Roizmanbacteria bacterium RIFCSPHIGHO2_02_FULL_38_11]OGK35435.1 MAG: 30S ribosomal protein S8 [Candidatus Roizmanbacteria bacterium RIFCSPHIGHO2_12_FULL_37_9b]OGK40925.1 MAG: 30S ribosomal protein S8 [Candidatus Roizmanbacteria bacterium RIFCSPLOWO2_01_FULL_37_13]
MIMQNSVIDLIIRIKNGYMARRESIDVSSSHFNEAVLMKLMQLGFIKKFQAKDRIIQVELLYKERNAAITDVQIFSKPGRRYYVSYKDLKPVLGGLGYSIISTSKGIFSNKEARKRKLGGELLFSIW